MSKLVGCGLLAICPSATVSGVRAIEMFPFHDRSFWPIYLRFVFNIIRFYEMARKSVSRFRKLLTLKIEMYWKTV